MLTAGIDEVGTGALAGPYISVVAVFKDTDLALLPVGVKDSKKCTEAQREGLYLPLCRTAFDVGVGHAWPWEIDQYSPYSALQLSYRRALGELVAQPDLLIVDGKNRIEGWNGQQMVLPKADALHWQVSAASIIAKVFRDRIMEEYAKTSPNYGWKKNKGYGTDDHIQAIKKLGLMVDGADKSKYLHRMTYCKRLVRV